MSEFRELEQLVARIQRDLAPDSEVAHNVRLLGRHTNRPRQIDVLVTQNVAQFDISIVIDCKDHKNPVDVKGVEEFSGLLDDVGAQKGVLVCPRGFTSGAKTRAEGLQIDLYSPIDTDPHKWQVKVKIPALCDYRSADISFSVRVSRPGPIRLQQNFFDSEVFSKRTGDKLGTITGRAIERWNNGEFPSEVGAHDQVSIFDEEVTTDNGYGNQVPVELFVGLHVTSDLFYGLWPLTKISGFKDELRGHVITNAFEFGIVDPEEVESTWLKIENEAEAPVRPVIRMTGLIAWVEAPTSERIMRGMR